MKNKKTPDIRFKGFTDDWEQRKLENWGTFYYGKSCPKWSITDNANIPCIRYGELYTKFGTKIDKIYSYTNMSPENLKFSKGKEVLIPRVGEDPMDYNHCTWLSMPNIAIGEMISVFNTENDPLFTATMFNATLQNEFACRVEGGSVTNLYFEKLKNIEVSFPKIDEQKKIGKYFDSLDNRITLHQRKLEKLKNFKKAMLEKMFPKNGKKTPEIRFQGFTDDWEQRKLSDIADVRDGTHDSPQYVDEGYPFITSKNVSNGYITYDDIHYISEKDFNEINKRSKVNAHDILMGMIGTIGNLALIREKTNFAIKNVALIKYTGCVNYNFLYQALQSPLVVNQLSGTLDGGTQKFISLGKIRKLSIPYSGEEEANKIGAYLENLDSLITLHQRKLEKLQQIKKAMLEKMFV